MKQLVLAFSLLFIASATSLAQGGAVDGEPDYDACLVLVERAAAAALDMSQTLKLKRGEDAAGGLHCEALALMKLNRPEDAGRTFFELAERLTRADDAMRAEIYGQAGDAFAIAGDAQNSLRAYDNAIARMPGEATYYAGRARVKAKPATGKVRATTQRRPLPSRPFPSMRCCCARRQTVRLAIPAPRSSMRTGPWK